MSQSTTRLARSSSVMVALLATLLGGPLELRGQDSEPAQALPAAPLGGFWIWGGVGLAFGRAGCDVCVDTHESSLAAIAALGGSVSPAVRLGLEGTAWRHKEADFQQTLWGANGVVYWYPKPAGPRWFVKAGLGVIGYRAVQFNDEGVEEDDAITSRGFGGSFGAGYALRVAPFMSINPYFNFLGSFRATLEVEGEQFADANLTTLQFGIGLEFH